MFNGHKVLFFAAAIMVFQINGQVTSSCLENKDCAGNTLATSKTCCTMKETNANVTTVVGICGDK